MDAPAPAPAPSTPTSAPAAGDEASAPRPPRRTISPWLAKTFRWLRAALRIAGQFIVIAWAGLAIYYSNLPWGPARAALAVAFTAFGIWALWWTRRPNTGWWFAATFGAVLIWWLAIPPSHDRPWRPEVAVLPRAIIDGDRVRLTHFRHFKYRSENDFDVRYEDRDISLDRIVSMDLFISYWKLGPVAHTFVSFNFEDGSPPVCISIETRPEKGESFNPLASMFKQFELVYVVGDERDIAAVRTDHRGEEVFLYRIRASPEGVRRLFRIYLDRINHLADEPEWYHLLSNNCTLNILRYARAAGGAQRRFDHRHLLNGFIDRYLYGTGVIDTSLDFEELRRRSHINDAARAAGDGGDFSSRIRAGLPDPNTPP